MERCLLQNNVGVENVKNRFSGLVLIFSVFFLKPLTRRGVNIILRTTVGIERKQIS